MTKRSTVAHTDGTTPTQRGSSKPTSSTTTESLPATEIPLNMTGNQTMHTTNKSLYSQTYLFPSIFGSVSFSVLSTIGITVYLRKRKSSQKKTLHKPPVLKPYIYKPNNTFEMRTISSSDDYLQPKDTQIYCSTVEPIYDVVT